MSQISPMTPQQSQNLQGLTLKIQVVQEILSTKYQCPQNLRHLSEIYCELGITLLTLGDGLEEVGQHEQAEKRYAEAAQAFRDAIREKPDSAELQLYLALAREAQKRFSDALQAYLEAIRLEPQYINKILPKAHQHLTREFAGSLGDWLEKTWRPAVETSHLDGEAQAAVYHFLGRAGLYRRAYRQAVEYFQRALANKRDDPLILEGLGEALWYRGKEEQATETLQQAVEILQQAVRQVDQTDKVDRQATTRFKLTRALMDLKRYKEALPLIEQGLALEQAFMVEFRVALGQCYLKLGRFVQALQVAEETLARDSTQVEAHIIRAEALYNLQRYTEASEAAELALRLAPSHLLAIRIKAEALIASNTDLEQAVRLLQVYTRLEPKDLAHQSLLIQTLRKISRPTDEIMEALNGIIAHAPPQEQFPWLLELAELYLQEKRPTDVLTILDKVARQAPHLQSARWWRLYGDAQNQVGQIEVALESYRKGLELDTTHRVLLEHYAELLTKTDNLLEAAKNWQALIKIDPDNGKAYLNLARVLSGQGNFSQALEATERALSLGEILAYELKAEILEALKSSKEKVAEAYFKAGQERYWRNEFQSAADLFERANRWNPAHVLTYWYWADALSISSYLSVSPYVDKEKIEKSLEVWEAGARIRLPGREDSWAYVARALINEQLFRLPHANQWTLWWEAIVYLERALLLDESEAYRWAALGRYYRYLQIEVNALTVTDRAFELNSSNRAVLEERAAILANVGRFAEAERVIDQRRKLDQNFWADAVKAFILLYLRRYQETLELINRVIETAPEEIWYRDIRALCYRMLGRLPDAVSDYRVIWSQYNPSDMDNRFKFGWAAYSLAILDRDSTHLLPEAIRIFNELLDDSTQVGDVYRYLGLCYLAQGDLVGGENSLNEGIAQAMNIRELDIFNFTLEEVEKFSANWSYGSEAREVLNRIREKTRIRRIELEQRPPSAEDELKQIIEVLKRKDERAGWAWIGSHAGLARLYSKEKRWFEVITIYRLLQKASDQFPEAPIGLENALDQLQAEGDNHLKEGEPGRALEHFRQMHPLLLEVAADDKKRQADLYSRMGYTLFELEDLVQARQNFARAIQLYRESNISDPGDALGTGGRSLLRDVKHYWTLEARWKTLKDEPEVEETLRHDLAVAWQSLAGYLSELYQLSGRRAKNVGWYMGVTPITLEIAQRLLPEGPAINWSLSKTSLPEEMRTRIRNEIGVQVPNVRMRSNDTDMPPGTYLIMLDDIPLAMGTVHADRFYCPVAPEILQILGIPRESLIEAFHPLTGEPGCWVSPDNREKITGRGFKLWDDPLIFIFYHLEAILRQNLAEFLGVQEVEDLIENWKKDEEGSSLIQAVLPDQTSRLRFARLLRALIEENVPITAWKDILKVVQNHGLDHEDNMEVVQAIRLRLKSLLLGNKFTSKHLELSPEIEDRIAPWL